MKTWQELDMTGQEELDNLITVRDLLAKHAAESVKLANAMNNPDVGYHSVMKSYTVDGLGLFNMSNSAVDYDVNELIHVLGAENVDNTPYHCGTVACIGGWCSLVAQGVVSLDSKEPVKLTYDMVETADGYVSQFSYEEDDDMMRRGPLRALFYPSIDSPYWGRISPKHAVTAINNVLEHGEPMWLDVLELGEEARNDQP